jgi:hypothetical protein
VLPTLRPERHILEQSAIYVCNRRQIFTTFERQYFIMVYLLLCKYTVKYLIPFLTDTVITNFYIAILVKVSSSDRRSELFFRIKQPIFMLLH